VGCGGGLAPVVEILFKTHWYVIKGADDMVQLPQDRIEVGVAPLLTEPERRRRGVEIGVRSRHVFDETLSQKSHGCQF